MKNQVFIQLLGMCCITVDGQLFDNLARKSRKGISVMEFLILSRGKPVSGQRLIREIWGSGRIINPENALKTQISRLRSLLNSVADGLGGCIVSDQGTYSWKPLPNVRTDVLEFLDLLDKLKTDLSEEEREGCYKKILEVYEGELYNSGDIINGSSLVNWLHRDYLEAVYAYIELLKSEEAYNEITEVCKKVLRVDEFNDHIHIEMMQAMASLNRFGEAAKEYRRVTRLSRKYLDSEPSEDMQACYKQLLKDGKTLKFNLDVIRNELVEQNTEWVGPYFCEFQAFKTIYNIQIRNLERMGSSIFLGVIMVGNPENEISSISRESAMAALQEIIRKTLRRGDIVTRFSHNIFAMLLTTVSYSTGDLVMKRIEEMFYHEYHNNRIIVHHRISPLGTKVS